MKLAVLVLLVVGVSTTFAFPKFLRKPQRPPPTPTPDEDLVEEAWMACGNALDRCEKTEKRSDGDNLDDMILEQFDKDMCKIVLGDDPTVRRKRSSSEEELPQEVDDCIWELVECVYDASEAGGMSRRSEGPGCKDVLGLGDDKGDQGTQDSDTVINDAGNARALRNFRQLLRKMYRKK